MENLDLEALAGQAMTEVFDNTILSDWFNERAKEDPEAAMAFLAKYNIEASACVNENGEIDLETFKKKLTFTQRISFMLGGFFGDFLGEQVEKIVPNYDVKIANFEEKLKEIKEDGGKIVVEAENIIYKAGNPWEAVKSLLKVVSSLGNVTTEGLEGFFKGLPIPVGSVAVIPPVAASGPMKYSLLKKIFEKAGVTVKKLTSPQNFDKPGDKEIFYVTAPETGLPVSEGNTVDKRQVEWYHKLYKMGKVSWFLTPALLAGIYMFDGLTKAKALEKAGIAAADATLNAQLDSLASQLKPAVVTTTTTTTTTASAAPTTNPE